MDRKKTKINQRDRFLKLSLRKNKAAVDENTQKHNRSSDVIILDESFDRFKSDFPKHVHAQVKSISPITISDSSGFSTEDLPHVSLAADKHSDRQQTDNASLNCSTENVSIIDVNIKDCSPSVGGWSPAQNIMWATPKHHTVPTTPQDTANTSLEQCSLKKIEQSHKKVLDDLYGDAWKSVSTKKLFKTLKDKFDNFNAVSKKLQFNDDDESDKENIRDILKTNRKLYLTGSDAKHKSKGEFDNTDKKSRKKLYTEKVPATPDVPRPKAVKTRNVNTTGKKKQAMSVTELVDLMRNDFVNNDFDTLTKTVKNFDSISKTDKNFDTKSKTDKNFDTNTKTDKDSDYLSENDKIFDNLSKNKLDMPVTKINNPVTKNTPDNLLTTNGGLVTKTAKNVDWLTRKLDEIAKLSESEFSTKTPDNAVKRLVTKTAKNVDWLTRKLDEIDKLSEFSTKTPDNAVKRLSFIGSLADNVPSWRCHIEALQYHDNFKTLHDQLARRLYIEFNRQVFGDQLDADMIITWDTKLRSTAGTTTNRLVKTAKGDRIRTSSIKLSTKVLDTPQRLRDTIIHEMCHAATWLIDGELKAGHGPLWKKWASRALRVFPELGEISRCHDLQIHHKYTFKCQQCGYSIQRHSKSIDVTKKCCGYCRGTFEIIVNRKKKDGVIVSTPARKGETNEFALYVKENYVKYKDGKTHAQVMKVLGEQFSARKMK